MILRIDPSIPLVWRTPTSMQLGVDRVIAVFDPVEAWQERAIALLQRGVPRGGLEVLLAERAEIDDGMLGALLERISPAIERQAPPVARPTIVGSGPLAEALGWAIGGDARESTRDAAAARGVSCGGDGPVIVVSDWTARPDELGHWLRRDRAHLPVVASDGGILVGPYVLPGVAPCAHCVYAHRRDADPAWTAIAIQLLDRPAPAIDRVRCVEAAGFVARLLRRAVDDPASVAGRIWRLGFDDASVTERRAEPHPECLCSAPQESGWALGPAPAAHRSPTTASASAWPA